MRASTQGCAINASLRRARRRVVSTSARNRLNRPVLRVADVLQIALDAQRFARLANSPSMPNQLMRKENPAIFRDHFHQIALDFLWVRILRQIEPPRKPLHVRIDDDSRRDSESGAQHHVRRLPRDARKRQNFVHPAGHFAVKFLDDLFAGAQDRFGLVAVEARGADFLFDIARVGVSECAGSWILLEEPWCNHVHALVGALRRKDRGDQKLERIVVRQRASGRGIRLVQPMQNRFHSPGICSAAECVVA